MISQERMRVAHQIATRLARQLGKRNGLDEPGNFGIRASEWPGVLLAAAHGARLARWCTVVGLLMGVATGCAISIAIARLL